MKPSRQLELLREIQQRLSVYLAPGPKGPQLIREALSKTGKLRDLLAAKRKAGDPVLRTAYEAASEMAERLSSGMADKAKECAERAIKALNSGEGDRSKGGSSDCC